MSEDYSQCEDWTDYELSENEVAQIDELENQFAHLFTDMKEDD